MLKLEVIAKKCLFCVFVERHCTSLLGFDLAEWYSVILAEFSLEAEQMAMWTPLEFSSCGDEWLCQNCVKRGLPTCWVHCDANRTASASRRAVVCD